MKNKLSLNTSFLTSSVPVAQVWGLNGTKGVGIWEMWEGQQRSPVSLRFLSLFLKETKIWQEMHFPIQSLLLEGQNISVYWLSKIKLRASCFHICKMRTVSKGPSSFHILKLLILRYILNSCHTYLLNKHSYCLCLNFPTVLYVPTSQGLSITHSFS